MELFEACGIIEDCIDSDWLLRFTDLFKSTAFYCENTDRDEYAYNTKIGSKEHTLISKSVNSYINNIINIHNPIIYSLKGRSKILNVHSDAPLTSSHGQPYYTFLIPLNGYDVFSTFVFDQTSDTIIGSESPKLIEQQYSIINNNVVDHPELTHLTVESRKRLSLNKKLVWKKNSILYWKSDHFHCSNDIFPSEFKNKKESFIIWTTH
jgi:hypothetical protein